MNASNIYSLNELPNIIQNFNRNESYIMKHGFIKSVVFDCFGTIMIIRNKTFPYSKLFKDVIKYNNLEKVEINQLYNSYKNFALIRTKNIFTFFDNYNLTYNSLIKDKFEHLLKIELNNIVFFNDSLDVFNTLQKNNINICICSNIALPYTEVVKKHFENNNLSHIPLIFSCFVNTKKPESSIYNLCCKQLNEMSENILFVGDSIKNDYKGPMKNDMQAIYLTRLP